MHRFLSASFQVYRCTCTHTLTHTRTHSHTHTHIYGLTHTLIHANICNTHTCTHAHTHTCAHSHTHSYMHSLTHIYTLAEIVTAVGIIDPYFYLQYLSDRAVMCTTGLFRQDRKPCMGVACTDEVLLAFQRWLAKDEEAF